MLLLIAFITGCGGNNITDPEIPSDNSDSSEEADLRFTFKQFDLDEGSFTLEVCSLNTVAFNASGFSYTYYDSEGDQITELDNFVGIPFQVAPAEVAGVCGESTEVSNIPLHFNKVENYFIANPDISEIKCTVHLTGADSNNNDFAIVVVSNLPIIEQGVEIQTVIANIATTPEPPEGIVPLTVAFDATGSWTEDVRGVARYCWSFGDDTHDCYSCSCPSELSCPTHTYEECGSYVATLCVWDYNDNMDCAAVVVNVEALEPKMTITANPATITPHETSTISVYVTDDCDNPVPDGTNVIFNTDNGTLSETTVETVDGVAETILTLDEAISANITAYYDGISASVTVRAVESLITVTANPATISAGDFSTISAYVVDDLGNPVADGTTIAFSTNEGILSSNFATTSDGIATVDLQMTRNGTAIVTATFGALTGNTMVTCTDGPIAVIENDTDDQESPLEITANPDCPYTITFNGYESIPGTQPPLCYEWTMTHPDGTVENLGCDCETDPYVFDECGIYVIKLTVCDGGGEPCDPCAPGGCANCIHCDSETMRIIVTDPEKPTAIITSSELIIGSEISITANETCAYPITFYGDNSTTSAICGDIQDYSWEIIDPDGNSVVVGDIITGGSPDGVRMTYGFDTCGTYLVELEITDGCERIASTFVTVEVSEPEGPTAVITSSEPIVGSIINVTGNMECPYTITFFGHESSTILECEDITEYEWQIIDPAGDELVEDTHFVTLDTPDGIKMVNNFNMCGVYAVKLTVTDACGNTDSANLSVIVSEPDGPTSVITSSEQIVDSTINVTGNDDCPKSITFFGHESSTILECGDITGYDWQIIDPNGSEKTNYDLYDDDSKMVFSNFKICGVYAVKLTVTDACGNTDSEALSVILTDPDGPTAVITGSPGDIEACDTCPYPVVFNGNSSTPGADCGGLTYAWSIARPTGAVDFTQKFKSTADYSFEVCGTYTITLEVEDGCGNSDSASVTLTVTEPDSPVAVITNNTADQTSPIEISACLGCPFEVAFDGTDSINNTICGDLTYAWTIQHPTGANTIGTNPAIKYAFEECGTHSVLLVVTDSCGNTDAETFSVIVSEPAKPKAVITNNTEDQVSPINITACPGSPFEVAFDGTDSAVNTACGDLTYAWTIQHPTAGDTTGTNPAIKYAFEECGTHSVLLVVTDGCGQTDAATFSVIVSEPTGPKAVMTNTTGQSSPIQVIASEGCPFEIGFDGTDSTSSALCNGLTYSWKIIEPDATEVTGTDSIIVHDFDQIGTHTVTLTVEDGCANTDSEMVTVIVSDCCITAAFDYLPLSPVLEGVVVYFDASDSSSDCGCGIETYEWDWDDSDGITVDATGEMTSHAFTEEGIYTVTLTVTDACDNEGQVTMEIAVVPSVPLDRADWTVMVFVGGDNNLDPAAWNDLEEMEDVGSTDKVNIVAQVDTDINTSIDGTYRYYVTGTVPKAYPYYLDDIVEVLPEQDMGDPTVMADFVNWATANYPADHYLLILWDHGGGWKEVSLTRGVMFDNDSGNYMTMLDLASGLNACDEHIDILSFDACLMGMVEIAYEIESTVADAPDYMLASERSIPNDGYPYDDFLAGLTSNPSMDAVTLGKTIVDDYIAFYGEATLSLIDLYNFSAKAEPVFTNFRQALMGSTDPDIATARNNAQLYPYTTDDIFKDVYDFAERINNNTVLNSQAVAVMTFINDVVVYEDHVGAAMADSHGLSIFLTDDGGAGWDPSYGNLQFDLDTDWGSFIEP